jgi:hypothetical protein
MSGKQGVLPPTSSNEARPLLAGFGGAKYQFNCGNLVVLGVTA